MADADSTLEVDGVVPSIPVSLLDVRDNPYRVKIYNSDNGKERFIVKGGEPVLCTPQDLATLGAFAVEVGVSDQPDTQKSPAAVAPVIEPKTTISVTSPGQSGQ